MKEVMAPAHPCAWLPKECNLRCGHAATSVNLECLRMAHAPRSGGCSDIIPTVPHGYWLLHRWGCMQRDVGLRWTSRRGFFLRIWSWVIRPKVMQPYRLPLLQVSATTVLAVVWCHWFSWQSSHDIPCYQTPTTPKVPQPLVLTTAGHCGSG